MKKMSKREQALRAMQLCTDEKGAEYLFYHGAFGDVRDYSPWTIAEWKQVAGNENC